MKKWIVTLGLLSASQAFAGITISDCVIVEPAPSVNRTALFFKAKYEVTDEVKALRLPSPEAILGGQIPTLTDHVEIHKTEMKDGVMKMQQIPKLFLKSNDVTELKKGGLHFMLMDLKQRPLAGEVHPVSLWMTYLSDQTCDAKVIKASELSH
jgi:copper(I)-binding protein